MSNSIACNLVEEGLKNLMEASNNLSRQMEEMNGKMGVWRKGWYKWKVRVKENHFKCVGIRRQGGRRSIQPLLPGEAHNLGHPQLNRNQGYQQPTFQTNKPTEPPKTSYLHLIP